MERKYRLTNKTILHNGHLLRRIQALRDFGDVRKGDLGGYVESERNLSHDGLCWLYDNSKCYEHGLVDEDSSIYDEAEVYGEGLLCENAIVQDKVKIYGTATVEAGAVIGGNGIIKNRIISENESTISQAIFMSGPEFNKKAEEWFDLSCVKQFLKADNFKITSDTKIVSDKDSDYLIYAWMDSGTLYWYSDAEQVFLNENCSKMFYFFDMCNSFDGLRDVYTNNVADMSWMFNYCRSLESISPLKNWKTNNVRAMNRIFSHCGNLGSIEGLKKWNVSSVTDMSKMFYDCRSLESIKPLENWITRSVKDVEGMFFCCDHLTSLEGLKNWDTSSVENMTWMFCDCKVLEDVSAIEAWDISNVEKDSFYVIFNSCHVHPHWDGTWNDHGTFTPNQTGS